MNNLDKIRGCLLGGWCGDAAGATLEFRKRQPTKEDVLEAMRMPGGGPIGVGPGQCTDDTELELACIRGLIGHYPDGEFPAMVIASRYNQWYHSGPFDIGGTCQSAFHNASTDFEMMHNAIRHSKGSEANGALMRSAGLAVWSHRTSLEHIKAVARADARLSHCNEVCQDCNAVYCLAIAHLLNYPGDYKGAFDLVGLHITNQKVRQWYEDSKKPLEEIEAFPNIGHVKHAFTLAMYFLQRGTPYEEAIFQTLMKWGDTDTNAKIVGSLMGAAHGIDAIPEYMKKPVLEFNCGSWKPEENGDLGYKRPALYHVASAYKLLDTPFW